MNRREIFAGNWKMNNCYKDSIDLVKGILKDLGGIGKKEVIVFPPSLYVKDIVEICKGTSIDVGIQNMYYEKEGAFTGEISPEMVKDVEVKYILIGHSERRHVFGETDDDVSRKISAAFEFQLMPVVCVGELLEEREAGNSNQVVKRQIEKAFNEVSLEKMQDVIIAYEPVWAIGTGKVATPDGADSMHKFIRTILKGMYNEELSNSIPVLYGGSVKPDNIAGLSNMEDIDGVLVGGASLKAKSFLDIIHNSQ
ncbi:MAG: triose-phosphate isomerase [Spirochaetota bacterium]|nr:triose-phosphate isomerase [Spirochaetota bacterium]